MRREEEKTGREERITHTHTYRIIKVEYPLLSPGQVEDLLKNNLYEPENIEILTHFSASVGHVCLVQHRVRGDQCIIKLIKPIAVVQSCAEYSKLCGVYPEGSCEHQFVLNMLESNGSEMNLDNERANVARAVDLYSADYRDVFGLSSGAALRSVRNIPGVVRPNCTYAMAMSKARGVPLSTLIESDSLEEHTVYRAKLQRAADLLLHTFFSQLVTTGFYHGDLHSGNVFYDCQTETMTVIDWGAVGQLDFYEESPDMRALMEIMKTFRKYFTRRF